MKILVCLTDSTGIGYAGSFASERYRQFHLELRSRHSDLLAFLLKRLLNAVFVMLAVALLAFLIFRFFGDPVEMMVNEQATQSDRAELRERLGLNDSMPVQYTRFVSRAMQGDFGMSYRNQQDVMVLIAERFPATMELVIVATVLSLVIGIPLGVLTTVYRDSKLADEVPPVSWTPS